MIVTCHCFFHPAKKLRSGAIVRFSDNSSFHYSPSSDDAQRGMVENLLEPWTPSPYTVFKIIMSARLCAAAWNIVGDCDETYNYWEPVGTYLKLRPSLNPELLVRTLCSRSLCQQDCVPRLGT